MWTDEPLLMSAYAFGDVVETRVDVDVVQVAFVLNLPVEDVAWCAQSPSLVSLPGLLEIDKAPVDWYWRPAVWPVSNHRIVRPLRIWSLDGPELDAFDALRGNAVEELRLPEPSPADRAEQLAMELDVSLTHLRRIEAGFWERDWRSSHRGSGTYPENHLWDAVHGYLDLLAAAQAAPNP